MYDTVKNTMPEDFLQVNSKSMQSRLNESNDTENEMSDIYLAETFYIISKRNTIFRVNLSEKGLMLQKETKISTKEQTISLHDIIGCRCLRSKRKRQKSCTALPVSTELKVVDENSQDLDETDVSAYLYIYAYILKCNERRNSSRRERTTITLRFRSFDKYEDNNREAQKWRTAIKQLIYRAAHPSAELPTLVTIRQGTKQTTAINMTPPAHSVPVPTSPLRIFIPRETRKLLVLLNPKSGSGKGRETFQKAVVPVFTEAEIPYELHITKYANYAREFVRTRDIYMWRSIVVVGGDGIYFEVINGLFERPDWQRAIETIPIGIIPCGSGNGLARTIAHVYK